MINLYIDGVKQYYIDEINNFSLVRLYDGGVNLSFDISPNHQNYKELLEERRIEYNNIFYIIKSINERKKVSTISAELDLDSLKDKVFLTFTQETKLLSEMLTDCLLGSGWTVEGAALISGRKSISLKDTNRIEILGKLQELYNVAYKYDTKNKKLYILNPAIIQYSGKYLTEELNLINKEYKGSTDNFITRVYTYGATLEDGTVVDITSVNDGVEYIDNNTYSDKIVSIIWRDERYFDTQSLKNAAIEMLNTSSMPVQAYTLKVVDLAKLKTEYEFLDFNLYDKLLLIDSQRKTTQVHEVIEIEEFPLEPNKNEIKLSALAQTVKASLKTAAEQAEQAINIADSSKAKIVELDGRVTYNAEQAAIEFAKRYTIGETDAAISNQIIVNNEELNSVISETYSTKGETDSKIESSLQQTKDYFNVALSNTGYKNLLKNSCGLNGFNNWGVSGQVEVSGCESISGSKFILTSGTAASASITQSIIQEQNKTYCISFKGKSISSEATQVKFIIRQYSDSDTYIDITNIFDLTSEFKEYSFVYSPSSINCEVIFINLENTLPCELTDIMLNEGELPVAWTQSEEELFTTNIKIDNTGIEVGSNTTDMRSKMTPSAFEIYRGQEKRINVAPDGTRLQRTIIEDDLTVGSLKVIKREGLGADFIVI